LNLGATKRGTAKPELRVARNKYWFYIIWISRNN